MSASIRRVSVSVTSIEDVHYWMDLMRECNQAQAHPRLVQGHQSAIIIEGLHRQGPHGTRDRNLYLSMLILESGSDTASFFALYGGTQFAGGFVSSVDDPLVFLWTNPRAGSVTHNDSFSSFLLACLSSDKDAYFSLGAMKPFFITRLSAPARRGSLCMR